MKVYTTEEARHIVMKCAKLYEQNLNNKKFLIIYKSRKENKTNYLELLFLKENYQHLTGVELIDNHGVHRNNVSELFYIKCLNNSLKKDEIVFKDKSTTNLKLHALENIVRFYNISKIVGEYDESRPYLIIDKVVGNVNYCLGIKKVSGVYVPVTALAEDARKLTCSDSSQVLCIFVKNKNDDIYSQVKYVTKGCNLNTLNYQNELKKLFTLKNYIFKG